MNLKLLKNKSFQLLVVSIVCVIFGILFCILTETMLDFLQTVLCFVALVYGGFHLVSYCLISYEDKQLDNLIHGIIPFAIGMLLMFVPSFFIIAVGVIVFALGIFRLIGAIRKKEEGWIVDLVFSIFFIIVGVVLVVLCNTNIGKHIVMIYLGVTLILEGVTNFVILYLTKKLNFKEELEKEKTKTETTNQETNVSETQVSEEVKTDNDETEKE